MCRLQDQQETMFGERSGGHVHVRVRVHQQQWPAHRHVRGHVHVRQLLRAQPDHGAAVHVTGLVGAGRAVHAAGRQRRVAAAAAPAAAQAVPAVAGYDAAQQRGRGRRGRHVVGGQEVPLPAGVGHAADAQPVGAHQSRAVHQLHIEQPTQLHVQAGRAAVHDDHHGGDHHHHGGDDDRRPTTGQPGSGRQRQQSGLGLVAQVRNYISTRYSSQVTNNTNN